MANDAILEIAGQRPFPLRGKGPWSIGRSEASDICFRDDPHCSRTQALIHRTEDGYVLEPISAATPTVLNGAPLADPHQIEEGDTIRFAAQTVRLVAPRRDEPSAPHGESGGRPEGRGGERIAVQDNQVVSRQSQSGVRGGTSELVLDHPAVSRRHAKFRVHADRVTIEDLGSTNGTCVNGRAIRRPTELHSGDIVTVGIFSLRFDGRSVQVTTPGEVMPLSAVSISKIVRSRDKGASMSLLQDVSLDIRPGELVCIVGESGSGKSTLMNIISGRNRPTGGVVRLGDLDIHLHFDSLKHNLAYVPQNNLLHDALTLRQALDFVARLRLPRDMPATERRRIVEEAALNVGLDQRLDVQISSLSGGQKKRASLATEILSRPKLLFLDEVTSGLDESTDREIMALLKRLSQQGATIVCVTHTLANIAEFADKVILMAPGGDLAFCGAPTAMLDFFGMHHLGEVFGALERRGPNYWRGQVTRHDSPSGESGVATGVQPALASGDPLSKKIRQLLHQFVVLTERNAALYLQDRRTLAMAAIQSLIIGALLGFAYQKLGASPIEISNSKLSFLLVLGITCLWIGCAGAAKDIVGELSIYRRERDINLSTLAFVLSKFLVTGIFTVAQIFLLIAICRLMANAVLSPLIEQGLLAALASVAGVALGLFISSISNSRDQAAVVVPLALAPQLILGSGLIASLPNAGVWMAKILIGSYWSREAMTSALISKETIFKVDPTTGMQVAVTAHSVAHSVEGLLAQTAGWIMVTIAIMYWRYAAKRE